MLEIVVTSVLTVVIVVYLCLRHHYSYWRRKGLLQAPNILGLGNFLDVLLMRKTPGYVYHEIYRAFPGKEAVGLYSFHTPKLLVRSPELIQKVLVSDFSSFHDNEFYTTKKLDPHFYEDPFCLKGEEWKPARNKLVSTMSVGRMKEIFPLMKEGIPRLDAYIEQNLGKDIETKGLATLFTMDNVSNVVFGINSDCYSDPQAAFRKMVDIQMNEFSKGRWKFMVAASMPKIRDLLGLKFVPTVVSDYIEKLMEEVSRFRVANNLARNDLFDYFVKKSQSMDDLMFYGVTFFIEGSETSSMVLSFTLYELAVNPYVQQTLYEEVRRVFGENPDPDFDTLMNKLPYLDKVIQESMRLYPIAPANIRECTKPSTLQVEGKPLNIEVGTPVVIPILSLQRDPQYFPDPDKFDPERFNSPPTPFTYMPFGEGPRICPGTRFAMTQVRLFLSMVVYKYKLVAFDKTPKHLTLCPEAFLLCPNETPWIRIEKRK